MPAGGLGQAAWKCQPQSQSLASSDVATSLKISLRISDGSVVKRDSFWLFSLLLACASCRRSLENKSSIFVAIVVLFVEAVGRALAVDNSFDLRCKLKESERNKVFCAELKVSPHVFICAMRKVLAWCK